MTVLPALPVVSAAPVRRRQFLPRWISAPVLVGLIVVAAWIIVAVTIDLWSPYNPVTLAGKRLQMPSWQHWLGTDSLGRDVLIRTLYGARFSLPIALSVLTVAVAIGCALGAIAGFVSGVVDGAIMRLADITLSFPPMLLAMAIAASLGPGLVNAGLAMVIVWWPVYARLMRAQVIAVKNQEHVEAAIAGGASWPRLLLGHILPLCWSPVLVNATMDFGQVVLLAASLSFIGLGDLPPAPEWGSMISEGAVRLDRKSVV